MQYKWECSAQLPHCKQAWWKNITSMPATTHRDIIPAPFPPPKPGDEVLPRIHPTREMPSLAGCSLSRIIHQLQDTAAWQGSQWTMRRPGVFCPLLSIFSTGPLCYFFSPYSYWSSFTMGSFLGKRVHPVSSSISCSSSRLQSDFARSFLQELAQHPAKALRYLPQQLVPDGLPPPPPPLHHSRVILPCSC